MAHLLLIEDDELILESLSYGLIRAGHTVDRARDGKEGLAFFRPKVTELVITDLLMPEQEGLETIAKLKRQFPEVKIIAISGGGRINGLALLTIAKKMGANRAIEKPFTIDAVLTAVKELLAEPENAPPGEAAPS